MLSLIPLKSSNIFWNQRFRSCFLLVVLDAGSVVFISSVIRALHLRSLPPSTSCSERIHVFLSTPHVQRRDTHKWWASNDIFHEPSHRQSDSRQSVKRTRRANEQGSGVTKFERSTSAWQMGLNPKLPLGRTVWPRLIRHPAFPMSRYTVGSDGMTVHQRGNLPVWRKRNV